MKKIFVLAIFLFLIFTGCGGDGRKVELPSAGFSMKLPQGWVVDSQASWMFYDANNRYDNSGMVEEYPLEGKTFTEFVDSLIGTDPNVTSRTTGTLAGHNIIRSVSSAEFSLMELYIDKGTSVIRVSFRCLPEDFAEQSKKFTSAINTIRLR